MKEYLKRFLAALAASAMLLSQSAQPVLAENTTETQASVTETTAAATETQAQAAETQAPAAETQTQATETQAAATETQAPVTETAAAETQTQATETTAAATETQTQATESETAAAETQTQATETAVAAETEPSQTVNETEAPSAAATDDSLIIDEETDAAAATETETGTETETETETETSGSFTYQGGNFTAVLDFTDGSVFPKTSVLTVSEVSGAARTEAEKLLREQTDHGHRELADFHVYTAVLKSGDGSRELALTEGARLTVTFTEPLSLGLTQNKNAAAGVFAIGSGASLIYNVQPDGNLCVAQVQISGTQLKNFAIAGITDLVNDGSQISSRELLDSLKDFKNYAVTANTYSQESTAGPAVDPDRIAAGAGAPETEAAATAAETQAAGDETAQTDAAGDGTTAGETQAAGSEDGSGSTQAEENQEADDVKTGSADTENASLAPQQISSLLSDLSRSSLALANAQSSDTVAVVNLFADEKGNFDPAPLSDVTIDDGNGGKSLDVSNRFLVINLVAANRGQELVLPSFAILNKNIPATASEEEKAAGTQGKVLYNVVALDDQQNYVSYQGKATMKSAALGTYLAPEGTVRVEKQLVGALYASAVQMGSEGTAVMSVMGGNPAVSAESTSESDQSESASGNESESTSESDQSESATENVSESTAESDQSESATENVSESTAESDQSESATENESESTSESDQSESASGNESESTSESDQSESATENVSESTSESDQSESTSETENAVPAENTVLTLSNRLNGSAIAGTYTIAVGGTSITKDDAGSELKLTSTAQTPATLDLTSIRRQLAAAGEVQNQTDSGETETGAAGGKYIRVTLTISSTADTENIYAESSEQTVKITMTADGSVITAVESTGNVTFEYLEEPVLRAGAVDAGNTDSGVSYLKGASFTLSAVTETGSTVLAEADADSASGIAYLHFSPAEIPSGAVLQLEETGVPGGYYVSDENHPRVISFDGKKVTDSQPVQISNRSLNLRLSIRSISTSGKKSSPLSGAVYTVEDESGTALTDIYGKELTATSGSTGTVNLDILPTDYSIFSDMKAGDQCTIQIVETQIPDGYISTASQKQQKTGCPVQTITVVRAEDGSFRVEEETEDQPYELTFDHRAATKLTLNISTVDDSSRKTKLSGAQYTVRFADGTPLKNSDGSSILIESTSIGQPQKIVLDETANKKLSELKTGSTLKLILSEVVVPDGYSFTKSVYGSSEKTTLDRRIKVVRSSNGQLTFSDNTTVMNVEYVHTKQSTLSNYDVIRVRKALMDNNMNAIYAVQDLDYYFALFDSKGTRVSGVETLTVKRGYSAVTSSLFSALTQTKYVVKETDRYGNPLENGDEDPQGIVIRKIYHGSTDDGEADTSEISYASGNKATVTFTSRDQRETQRVSFANSYRSSEYPDYFSSSPNVYIEIRKIMLDSAGNAFNSKDIVYFRVDYASGDKAGTKILSGHYQFQGRSSASITVPIAMSRIEAGTEVSVTETDSIGYALTNSGRYTVSSSKDTLVPRTVEAKGDGYDSVTITNQLNSDSSDLTSDSEDDYGDGKAKLTLTKKVMYKGRNMRVNSVYYIGIWRNSSLSGEPYYVRALTFKNASQVSATLTINLNKAEGNEVTFWFAEVDEDGNKVTSGSEFGYNISQNKTSATLKAGNMSDEIVITNEVVSGSQVESDLTDAYSGFAGDSSALAEAQELANSGSITSAKTGDTSPLVPLMAALIISAAVILLLIVVIHRRQSHTKGAGDSSGKR